MSRELGTLIPLMAWLTGAGLSDSDFEIQGELLIVKLSPADRSRLLADAQLRTQLVSQARMLGFSRVALEMLI